MNWIEIPAGRYKLLTGANKKSFCQIEFSVRYVLYPIYPVRYEYSCRWNEFISHPPDGAWSKLAPLRILSFDIECAGRKGIFPEPGVDPVIQIANMVTRQGTWYVRGSMPFDL